MGYGLRISKPGFSTDPDSDNYPDNSTGFALTTDYPVLKVTSEGEDSVTVSSGNTDASDILVDNYTYRPETWCFVEISPGSSTRRRVPCAITNGRAWLSYESSDVKLNIYNTDTGSDRTYGYYAYVFGDSNE